LIATGGLEPSALSVHLQACALLIQPYNDGVSTRRGSVMAGLAHGRPIVSNLGINTEPIWPESAAMALAPAFDPLALVGEVEAVLADPARRARLGADGLAVYDRHFALERTIEAMTADRTD
jgi:glycosyltransferase involved in cell wall biosynthesis